MDTQPSGVSVQSGRRGRHRDASPKGSSAKGGGDGLRGWTERQSPGEMTGHGWVGDAAEWGLQTGEEAGKG